MLKVNRKGKNHLSAICGNRMELMEFGLLNLMDNGDELYKIVQ